jgi:hypothetical protein
MGSARASRSNPVDPTENRRNGGRRPDRFGFAGIAIACIVGCCAGPVLAVVGVGTVTGTAALLLGASGIIVAAVTIAGLVAGRRLGRQRPAPADSVQVTLRSRDTSSDRTR